MNITKSQLKNLVKEKMNGLINIEEEEDLDIPTLLSNTDMAVDPTKISTVNENLLHAAKIATRESYIVETSMLKVVSMLREGKTEEAKSKLINIVDSISNIVSELDKFDDHE